MHDQDDRQRSQPNASRHQALVNLPFEARGLPAPIRPIYRGAIDLSTIRLINASRPQRLHHQIDHVLAACAPRGGLLRSLPKIADRVGVLEKKK